MRDDEEDSRPARAAALFAAHAVGPLRWHIGRLKADGRPFFLIPSERAAGRGRRRLVAHWANRRACTCRDWSFNLRRRAPCKHMLAVRLWVAAWQRGDLVVPRPRSGGHANGRHLAKLETRDGDQPR